MVEFVFNVVFGCNGSSVIIVNDDNFVVLGIFNGSVKSSFGVVGEFFEFEYISGVVL